MGLFASLLSNRAGILVALYRRRRFLTLLKILSITQFLLFRYTYTGDIVKKKKWYCIEIVEEIKRSNAADLSIDTLLYKQLLYLDKHSYPIEEYRWKRLKILRFHPIPSSITRSSFETRGKEFLSDRIGTRSLFGSRWFKDWPRSRTSRERKNRVFAQRADVEDIRLPCSITTDLRSYLISRERKKESPARNFLVSPLYTEIEFEEENRRSSSPFRMHRDLTRCAPPDPYLRRGLPRVLLSTTRFSSDLSTSLWRNGVLQKGGGDAWRALRAAAFALLYTRSMISVFFLFPRRN